MKTYYDPATNGFYHEEVHGAREVPAPQSAREANAGKRPVMVPNPDCLIPATAVPIKPAEFDRLMAEQAAGKRITVSGDKPVAVVEQHDEQERQILRRVKRDRILVQTDWTQLPDIRKTPPAVKLARKVKASDVLAWLKLLNWPRAGEFIRIKETLDKQAIIKAVQADSDVAQIFDGRLTVDQVDEFFIDAGLDEDAARKAIAAAG